MKLSNIMSKEDWETVKRICAAADANPKLIAAIGWHETHWGRLGMGRYGYHLGVSCWTRTRAQYELDKKGGLIDEETRSGYTYGLKVFKGLEKQVKWAVDAMQGKVSKEPSYEEILNFAKRVWKPGDPEAWAKSVYSIYKSLEVDYGGVNGDKEGKKIEGIDEVIKVLEEVLGVIRQWKERSSALTL